MLLRWAAALTARHFDFPAQRKELTARSTTLAQAARTSKNGTQFLDMMARLPTY